MRLKNIKRQAATSDDNQTERNKKVNADQQINRQQRIKMKRTQNVAVKKRVKTACQTATRTVQAGYRVKWTNGKKSRRCRIKIADDKRARCRRQNCRRC